MIAELQTNFFHQQEKLVSSPSWVFASDTDRHRAAGELMKDHRARLALEEAERAERRRRELEEQRSDSNSANVRIRAWEKVHGLRLPSDPEHPILDVIASDTRLTLAEVQGVQEVQRKQARAPRP
jgi:hypothetical protein